MLNDNENKVNKVDNVIREHLFDNDEEYVNVKTRFNTRIFKVWLLLNNSYTEMCDYRSIMKLWGG